MSSRLLVPSRQALVAALARAGERLRAADLIELPRRGLAHRHWRLRRRGLVIRAPILPAGDRAALDRQAEIFRRAAPSGHTPLLRAVLPPAADLPLGALLVEEVKGRLPRLPGDLAAIAAALAAIHALPLPPPGERAPLDAPEEPFAATLAVIDRNLARGLPELPAAIRALIAAERDWAQRFAAADAAALRASPRALVVTDAHPRNFLITSEGRAVCLDLERALYGAPAIDLAHAVLPIAIAWGRAGERVSEAQRQRFLTAYLARRGAAASRALQPWLAPFGRLTALRTTAAYAAFRASGAERVLSPAARALARRAIADALDPRTLVGSFGPL